MGMKNTILGIRISQLSIDAQKKVGTHLLGEPMDDIQAPLMLLAATPLIERILGPEPGCLLTFVDDLVQPEKQALFWLLTSQDKVA